MRNYVVAAFFASTVPTLGLAEIYPTYDYEFANCSNGDFILRVYEDGLGVIPTSDKTIVHAVERTWSHTATGFHIEASRFHDITLEYNEYITLDTDSGELTFYHYGAKSPYYVGYGCSFHNTSLFNGFETQ